MFYFPIVKKSEKCNKTMVEQQHVHSIWNQESFDEYYGVKFKTYSWKQLLPTFRSCSLNQAVKTVENSVPVIKWLPRYKIKAWLPTDIVAGITIGIMHIPQGMAYGMLAGLDPVHGLYLSFFLPLIYSFFGTSKHVSMGVFAIASLLTGGVVSSLAPITAGANSTAGNKTSSGGCRDCFWCGEQKGGMEKDLEISLQIAATLTLSVGVIQIFLGLLRLGILVVFLSDQLVEGLTTGAAVHILTSQVKHLTGIPNLGRDNGIFGIFKFYGCFFVHLDHINWPTVIMSAICIFSLLVIKEFVDPKTRPKIRVPIPGELMVVIFTTLVSWKANISDQYSIAIVGNVPKGIQPPVFPPVSTWLMKVLPHAFPIAIVVYSLQVSVAKLFAKRNQYKIDPNQEWLAYGLGHIGASFFQCPVGGASLSRSLIMSNLGSKSQMPSWISCSILSVVLFWLAPLLTDLPKCALSSIIVVLLRSMFRQLANLPPLYKKSKIDFLMVFIDVSLGLGIAIVFSISTTIYRSIWPHGTAMAKTEGLELYKGENNYSRVVGIPGVKIFRFDSPLYYGNAERFASELYKTIGADPMVICKEKRKQDKINSNFQEKIRKHQLWTTTKITDYGSVKNNTINWKENGFVTGRCGNSGATDLHHVIIDCSSFTYIDLMGVECLIRIYEEYKTAGVTVIFAHCKEPVRYMFEVCQFYEKVPKSQLYVTVASAVNHACSNDQKDIKHSRKLSFDDMNWGKRYLKESDTE